MAAQHQRRDRQQQRLDPQQQCVNEPDRIDRVQSKALRRAQLAGRDQLVIAGVGVDDATASSRHVLEPALVERLQEYENRAWSYRILRFDELLSAAKLT